MELTPAEELLLVSARPGSGRLRARESLTFGVAGAVLMELAVNGRIVVRDRRLVAVDGWDDGPSAIGQHPGGQERPQDRGQVGPLAEEWWKRVRARERPWRPQQAVAAVLSGKVYNTVRAGLHERGLVQGERGRALGLFPRTRWSAADPAPGLEARDRLARAVAGGGADERTVALVLLADACGLSGELFAQTDRRARKERIKKLSQGPWTSEQTGEAVLAVVQGVRAAISAARAAQASS